MPSTFEPHEKAPGSIDSSVAQERIAEDSARHRWSLPRRIAFRFAFCYLGGFCMFNGNATVWQSVPMFGNGIQEVLARVFLIPAEYLAQRVFHVRPPGNHLHPTGSGDTAIDWISVLLLALLSLIVTGVWSALDRHRPHYQTMSAWLRFLIRLTLGIGMVTYGMAKVFPLQMPQPSVSALSEPLGMHSPMSVLWNFIGMNPLYESVCGAVELTAGLMILFRRTALAGALFTAFVVSNVLLYNLFFDVPVKLYSLHLLLLSVYVILPDAGALFSFFWKHQPSAPTGVWVPPGTRSWFRRTTIAIEIVFAVLVLGTNLYFSAAHFIERRTELVAQCELCSAWRVDSATHTDASAVPWPFQGLVSELVIESPARALLRDTIGKPAWLQLAIIQRDHTLQIGSSDRSTVFRYGQPDPWHLTLMPLAGAGAAVTLTRTTPLTGYPLLHRGFHWITEYPYQR